MLFYIPPLLPVVGRVDSGSYDVDEGDYFGTLDKARVPIRYMARLFAAGNVEPVRKTYEKLLAARLYKRAESVGDLDNAKVKAALTAAELTPKECAEIYRLTSLPTFEDRFVIPPMHREYAVELMGDPYTFKAETGVGFHKKPERGL
jgi:nitrate reductase beta subunit